MGDSTEYTRLHIAPLSADILSTILPPSILPHARNITYHQLQAFPEKPYGFVDLPAMDAAKLKTKLNGSTLKGQKIKIDSAKPKREHVPEEPEQEKPKRVKNKRKRDEIPGAEIGERSVKRGWTEPGVKGKEDKKKVKSKYTTGKECLFKTVLPPNVEANVKAQDKKEKKNKGKSKVIVIHEFEKTTKYPTFLRASVVEGKKKGAKEFVEGKGWVDENGEVIEPDVTKRKAIKQTTEAQEFAKEKKVTVSSSKKSTSKVEKAVPAPTVPEDDTSTSGSSSEEESDSEEETTLARTGLRVKTAQAPKEISPTSSSGTSSASDFSSSSPEDEAQQPDPPSTLSTPLRLSRPTSSSGLTIKIPPSALSTPSSIIHPLEALYKKTPSANANTASTPKPASAFSFFGADAGDDIEEEDEEVDTQISVPFTPYTQRDIEYRRLRSAAPTPDTVHGNKRFLWPTPASDSDSDADREGEGVSPVKEKKKEKGKANGGEGGMEEGEGDGEQESDFQKWFYEHRGEAGRAWKKRRREVGKEKRQRENRKRGARG
jgi:hypothetical protein